MRTLQMLAVTASLAVLAAAPAPASAQPARATGVQLMASLSGAPEVPGPGDPDGTGMFSARLNVGQGQLCYTLTSSNIGTPTMAHIHTGATGVAGPPVVTLAANAPTETCMAVDKDVAQKIVAAADGFYVNVHTADFRAGAVRGQLMKH